MYVNDTVLYVPDTKSCIRTVSSHSMTKEKIRLTDGRQHPTIVYYPDGTKGIILNGKTKSKNKMMIPLQKYLKEK